MREDQCHRFIPIYLSNQVRGPEKSRGKGLEPDDISQKKSIEHWCLLFTLSYTIPGVPLRLQCHLGSKPSKMMYSLKRKDSIFAQERHTVVMVEFPKSLNEQTPASSVIPSLAFIVQPSLSPTFKQSEKRANYISTTILCQ